MNHLLEATRAFQPRLGSVCCIVFLISGCSCAIAQRTSELGPLREDAGISPRSANESAEPPGTKVNGVLVSELMKRLGVKLETGASLQLLDSYADHFDRTDPNRDGKHTKAEYVDGGRYMTPQARAGIFNAADENQDRVVTRSEYVLNRIITDEGKEIIQAMDSNQNGTVDSAEFVEHGSKPMGGEKLASGFFQLLDRNGDALIPIPEYLRVWGQLAREGRGDANARIKEQRERLARQPPAKPNQRQPHSNRNDANRAKAGDTIATPPRSRPNGPPPVEEVFARFDKNRDGKLVEAEIATFVRKFILPADSNHDKAVTKEELEAYRKQNPRAPNATQYRKPNP
jgi:Ca2+-binding EF-hand superfamily protein